MTSNEYTPVEGRFELLGIVTSLVSISDDFVSLKLTIGRRLFARALISAKTTEGRIEIGQVWTFVCESNSFDDYGENLLIHSGRPAMAAGEILIPFLRSVVPELGVVAGQRLSERLGNDLLAALEDQRNDVLSVALPKKRAQRLIGQIQHAWQCAKIKFEIMEALFPHYLKDGELNQIVQVYGSSALRMIKADPYRLLAFSSFDVVDKIATDKFSMRLDEHRRLLGFVEAAVNKLSDGGLIIINQDELLAAMSQISPESHVMFDDAISAALDRGYITKIDRFHLCGGAASELESSVFSILKGSYGKLAAKFTECNRKSIECIVIKDILAVNLVLEEVSARTSPHDRDATVFVVDASIKHLISCQTEQLMILEEVLMSPFFESYDDSESGSAVGNVIVVSSTVDIKGAAALIHRYHSRYRMVFVGELLRGLGYRSLIIPLIADTFGVEEVDLEVRNELISFVSCYSKFSSLRDWSIEKYEGGARNRTGVFYCCVDKLDFCTAVLGIAKQLSEIGALSIVTPNLIEYDVRELFPLYTGLSHLKAASPLLVGTVDELESAATESAIVLLPQLSKRNFDSVFAAIKKARSRAILVMLNGQGSTFASFPTSDESRALALKEKWRAALDSRRGLSNDSSSGN